MQHRRTSARFHLLLATSLTCIAAAAQQPAAGSPPFRSQPRQAEAAQEAATDATLPSHVRGAAATTTRQAGEDRVGGTAGPVKASETAGASGSAAAWPRDPRAMRDLQDAADHLRESIRALSQKSGAERQAALQTAHLALMRTESAMHALPGRLRTADGGSADEQYSRSVRQLMMAADALRNSVQNLADQPASQGRNQAIAVADKALLDTQAAMADAYDASLQQSAAMGAQSDAPSGHTTSTKQ